MEDVSFPEPQANVRNKCMILLAHTLDGSMKETIRTDSLSALTKKDPGRNNYRK